MASIVEEIRANLVELGDNAIRESSRRFFKDDEAVLVHGLKSADVRKIAKQGLARLKGMDKKQVFKLCGELWKSGYQEEIGVACEWSHAMRKHYEPGDMKTFEDWLGEYVANWASCDTLCNHTIGTLVEMYPDLVAVLRKWAGSKNRWKKRGAAVTLIVPARKGLFLDDVLAISDALIRDDDHLVQKGYGWALKAASEAHLPEVFKFVIARRTTMPRTAYRYAIEKMPAELRAEAMGK